MPAVRSSSSSAGPSTSRAAKLRAAGATASSVSAAERAVSSSRSSASNSSSASRSPSRASPLAPIRANAARPEAPDAASRDAADRGVRKPSPAPSLAPSEAKSTTRVSDRLGAHLEHLKERGNEAFERKSFDEAYLYYTAAIHESPVPEPKFYLNRSLLASRCQLHEQALYDARRAFAALEGQEQASGLDGADLARVGGSWLRAWKHRCAKAKLCEAEALNALGRDPRPALQESLKWEATECVQTLLAQIEARCATPSAQPKFGLPVRDALAPPWQLVASYGVQGLFPSEEEYERRLLDVKREFRASSGE